MNDSATMPTGPLDSTGHVLRADAGTIAEPAAIDWTRRFRRDLPPCAAAPGSNPAPVPTPRMRQAP